MRFTDPWGTNFLEKIIKKSQPTVSRLKLIEKGLTLHQENVKETHKKENKPKKTTTKAKYLH